MTNGRPDNTAATARIDLLLKAIPAFGVMIYITGYLIRLAYFRTLNVHSIDFLKAQCFETGISFIILSLALLSLPTLPIMLFFFKKAGKSFAPAHASLTGMLLSIIAVTIVLFVALIIALFILPQDFPNVSSHLAKLLILSVVFMSVIVALNIFAKHIDKQKLSGATPPRITGATVGLIGDALRFLMFPIVLYYTYCIVFVDSPETFRVIRDPRNLLFVLYLVLFSGAATRLGWRLLKQHDAVKNDESDKSGEAEESKQEAKRLLKYNAIARSLSIFLLPAMTAIFFFLVMLAFTFGPFLYIPTSKGGGLQYSVVKLVFEETANRTGFPFLNKDSTVSSKVYLLSENDSWLYVSPYDKLQKPRETFRSISMGTTYCVDKKRITAIMFDKIK